MSKYSRETHKAYPEISVQRHPVLPRAEWVARVYSYKPLGYRWNGTEYPEWPAGVPEPKYPEFPHNGTREQIAEWRNRCNKISDSNPTAITLIEQMTGFSDAESADIAYENCLAAALHAVDQVMQWQLR